MAICRPNKLDWMVFLWVVLAWVTMEHLIPDHHMKKVFLPAFYTVKTKFYFERKWNDYQERAAEMTLPVDFKFPEDPTLEEAVMYGHAALRFGDDPVLFGRADYIATISEAYEVGARGDCDEFAALWYEMLSRKGWEVVLAIGYLNNDRNQGHAVALVRKEDGSVLVLDMNEPSPSDLNRWLKHHKATLTFVGNGSGTTSFKSWLNN